MTAIVVALGEPAASAVAAELEEAGQTIAAICAPEAIDDEALARSEAAIIPASREVLTPALIARCDLHRVRLLTLGGHDPRLARRLGIAAVLPAAATTSQICAAIETPPAAGTAPDRSSRVMAVWGPAGAPGRSLLALHLAAARAQAGRQVALIDADTHAPSLAQLLALGDDSPGIAAACRRAQLGGLDTAELSRLALNVRLSEGTIDVLAGLNRPSRWPELSSERLRAALTVCRDWTEDAFVDIAAPLEHDEELSYDVDTPRRNAAGVTVLQEADAVVAVASAEPLGLARFLQAYPELRALVGATPIVVVVNRVRPGPIGIDPRGQIRRTLERFAGIRDIHFLPEDRRGIDNVLLHARPLGDIAPKSPFATAVRALAAALPAPVTADTRPGSSRGARSPR